MSVIDILFRVEDICKKYDKYDVERQRSVHGSSEDAFARLYASFDSQIEATLKAAAMETNRATEVALKAEVRRMKARLMDEVPKLQKLAQKKVKGLSKEELEARFDLVLALPDRIQAIPDGTNNVANQKQGWGALSSHKNIKFDSDGNFGSEFFEQSEEANQFRREYEMRKLKQDQGLDVISDGLDTLKNLARDMNEELDRQVPLVDEINTKVDKATSEVRNANIRLKDTLFRVRSSQNFCIDIILLCIFLGIASYLYNVIKQ